MIQLEKLVFLPEPLMKFRYLPIYYTEYFLVIQLCFVQVFVTSAVGEL